MKPSQTASTLRRIASAIDNSKNPDRNLVIKDLQLLTNRIAAENKEALVAPKYRRHTAGSASSELSRFLRAMDELLDTGDKLVDTEGEDNNQMLLSQDLVPFFESTFSKAIEKFTRDPSAEAVKDLGPALNKALRQWA